MDDIQRCENLRQLLFELEARMAEVTIPGSTSSQTLLHRYAKVIDDMQEYVEWTRRLHWEAGR